MEPRVAVIGAGVAGLSTAYHLRGKADVTIFEASGRAGGHANTIEVPDGDEIVGLDTGFIVFNEPHYPRLSKFFADLGVPSKPHPGKFSFFDLGTGTNYASDDLDLAEDEVRARFPESFVNLWREANRFYRESPRDFLRKKTDISLGEYLDRNGYSDEFRYGFVVLIGCATWSVPAEKIWEMPASTLIAFFFAHGGEGLGGRTVPWRTVTGGSISYVRAALRELDAAGQSIRFHTPIGGVSEQDDAVIIRTAEGPQRFDYAVLATHADDSLALLERPNARQRTLDVIKYHPTRATLHTDVSVMPTDRSVWRSWNYGKVGTGPETDAWVVYYLNYLQDFTSSTDYFVTLDSPRPIRDESIIVDLSYRHPILNMETRRLQHEISAVNGDNSRVKFAGSYFHSRAMGPDIIGMHESAFDSGIAAAEAVVRTASRQHISA